MNRLLLFLFITISVCANAQNMDRERVSLRYLNQPIVQLSDDIKTYGIEFVDCYDEEIATKYNATTIKGIVTIPEKKFVNSNADLNLKVEIRSLDTLGWEVPRVDSKTYKAAEFKIKYKLIVSGTDKSGKSVFEYMIDNHRRAKTIKVPPHMLDKEFSGRAQYVRYINDHKTRVTNIALENARKELFSSARIIVHKQVCWKAEQNSYEFVYPKTTKKENYDEWKQHAETVIASLKKHNLEGTPSKIEAECKASIAFWTNQIKALSSNIKENKKLIGAAANNLSIAVLYTKSFADLNVITDEMLAAQNWRNGDECKALFAKAKSASKVWDSARDNNIDWKKLSEIPALFVRSSEAGHYLVSIVLKGKEVPAVLSLRHTYMMRPHEANYYPEFITLVDFNKAKNKGARLKPMKNDEIEQYEVQGVVYKKIEYKDPTALSIGGNSNYCELISEGSISVYRSYPNSEDTSGPQAMGPYFIASTGKKAQVISTYKQFQKSFLAKNKKLAAEFQKEFETDKKVGLKGMMKESIANAKAEVAATMAGEVPPVASSSGMNYERIFDYIKRFNAEAKK